MKIYLAGKMSGLPEWGFPLFDKAQKVLENKGHEVISPAQLDREEGFDEKTETVFTEEQRLAAMRRDYRAICEVDAVCFLSNAHQSTGALLERKFARKVGAQLLHYDGGAREGFFREIPIGIAGYAGSGKDTVGQMLSDILDYPVEHFADTMRHMLYAINPDITGADEASLQRNVDTIGWDAAKRKFPQVREMLQRLGTEGGRDIFGENFWIDNLFDQFPQHGGEMYHGRIIPDVRFANEAKAIKDAGGFVVRVDRPGVGPANAHASERLEFEPDFGINNDGTLDFLLRTVLKAILHWQQEGWL